MLELTTISFSVYTPTVELLDWLYGFFTFWICMGVMVNAAFCVVDLFHPQLDMENHSGINWALGSVIGVIFWPYMAHTTYLFVCEIKEDMDRRKFSFDAASAAEERGFSVTTRYGSIEHEPYVHVDCHSYRNTFDWDIKS